MWERCGSDFTAAPLNCVLYMARTSSIWADPVMCQRLRLKDAADADEQGKDVKQRLGNGQSWMRPARY